MSRCGEQRNVGAHFRESRTSKPLSSTRCSKHSAAGAPQNSLRTVLFIRRLLLKKKAGKPKKSERLSCQRQCGSLKRTSWSDRSGHDLTLTKCGTIRNTGDGNVLIWTGLLTVLDRHPAAAGTRSACDLEAAAFLAAYPLLQRAPRGDGLRCSCCPVLPRVTFRPDRCNLPEGPRLCAHDGTGPNHARAQARGGHKARLAELALHYDRRSA